MHLRTKLTLLAVMVIGIFPAAANAYACDNGHSGTHSGVAGASFTMERHHGYGLLRASATYLGVSVSQLRTDLKNGQSLGQVANATSGKSATGLVSYLAGLVQTKLDKLVTAGKITSTQESTFLTKVEAKLTSLVNATPKAFTVERMDWHH